MLGRFLSCEPRSRRQEGRCVRTRGARSAWPAAASRSCFPGSRAGSGSRRPPLAQRLRLERGSADRGRAGRSRAAPGLAAVPGGGGPRLSVADGADAASSHPKVSRRRSAADLWPVRPTSLTDGIRSRFDLSGIHTLHTFMMENFCLLEECGFIRLLCQASLLST